MKRRWDSQINPQFPIPAARVRDNDPAGQMPTPENDPDEATAVEERNQEILRGTEGEDAGLPEASEFGHPTEPDSPHGASGNWNAAGIYENTKIGG